MARKRQDGCNGEPSASAGAAGDVGAVTAAEIGHLHQLRKA
jgi:hypothetical protein